MAFHSFIHVIFQAPFFPREAVSKGLEVWHFGLVFGAFEITVFIVSPIIGANLNRIGVKVCVSKLNYLLSTLHIGETF